MPDTYNSNNVGHSVPSGGGMTFKTPAGATLGVFEVTALTPERQGGAVAVENFEGGAGGFALGADGEKQNTCSATITIRSNATTWPYRGCYVDQNFKRGAERWVLIDVTDNFQANTPWTMTGTFWRDHEV